MKSYLFAVVLGIALLLPSPVAAAPSVSSEIVPAIQPVGILPAPYPLATTATVTGTTHLTGTIRIATLLATYFDRDVQEILDLHARDLGFGCIAKALFIAVEANVPLSQVLEMHLSGIGWGEIRQNLGLPAQMPHASLGQVIGKGHGPKGSDWVPPGLAKKGLTQEKPFKQRLTGR
ncbi:MAG: hypothetical protein ACP5SI_12665 [Chloroflexia bacterium]